MRRNLAAAWGLVGLTLAGGVLCAPSTTEMPAALAQACPFKELSPFAQGAPPSRRPFANTFLSPEEAYLVVDKKTSRLPFPLTNATEAVEERLREMAEAGYEMVSASSDGKNVTGMSWTRNPRLVSQAELSDPRFAEPAWVLAQRQELKDRFKRPVEPMNHAFEVTNKSPGGTVLTAKTLSSFEPGTYNFVVLHGENFARLSPSAVKHREICGTEMADAAGEVTLVRTVDGQILVTEYNLKSGTFTPRANTFKVLPEVLWRQGIYPEKLIGRFLPGEEAEIELRRP